MSVNLFLTSSIICLLFVGTSYAFAADVYFDQSVVAMEHSGNLLINDPNASGNSITANITSSTPQIPLTLERIGTSTVFESKFIKFTASASQEYPPELRVSLGSNTITIVYDANTFSLTVDAVDTNGSLAPEYNSIHTFRAIAARGCSATYGGDADHDGICDNWETGTRTINYPTGSNYTISCTVGNTYADDPTGATVCPNTNTKDIYVEIDWMAGHKPDVDAIYKVVEAFNKAPPSPNPFQLHVILDEQILPHINEISFPGSSSNFGFDHIKAKEFGTDMERQHNWIKNQDAKSQIFYYYLWGHDQSGALGTSGIAEEGGNDGGITLGSFDGMVGNEDQQAGTFMHELGHNLGIDHGGDKNDEDNCKPNLMSVMSYSRQFTDLVPNRLLDYSRLGVGPDANTFTFGSEDQLGGKPVTFGPYPPQGDAMIVFGIQNGATTLVSIPTDASAGIYWPANWDDIRYIKDSTGKVVCDKPTTPATLDSVNQWSYIDLSQKNSHWREGRSGGN